MKKMIGILLSLLLCVSCGQSNSSQEETEELPPVPTEDPYVMRARGILETMDVSAKIEQLLVLDIQTYNGSPFMTMNEETTAFFENHSFGGFILFGSNLSDPESAGVLIQNLQSASCANNGIGMLIATDQEGGYVTRIQRGTITPGAMALGAGGRSTLAASAAEIIAGELSVLGINTDFAPSADINNEPANPIIGIRSFSDDPLLVSELSVAFADALQEQGIVACAKHFPGHGNTLTDSHTGLPTVDLTLEELRKNELIPFQRLASSSVDMIMTAHIRFPNVEQDTYTSILDGEEITLPSTLSHVILEDLLREELGYDGVVITDSLQMDAIRSHFDVIDTAVLAWNAGADMLLMPVLIEDADGLNQVETYVETLASLVGDLIDEARIDEAVLRVLTLKARRGILDAPLDRSEDEIRTAVRRMIGSEANHESERAITDQTVTVLENHCLPLSGDSRVLFAGVQKSQKNSLWAGYERLKEEGLVSGDAVFLNYSWGAERSAVLKEIEEADAVVITSWLDNISQFDPSESNMIPSIQAIMDACKAASIPCIVISSGLPYDVSCYEEADALLAVYNPVGITYDEEAEVLRSGPNLMAALDIIFGAVSPSGTLPVNVPKVIDGRFTKEIAYPKGSGLTW